MKFRGLELKGGDTIQVKVKGYGGQIIDTQTLTLFEKDGELYYHKIKDHNIKKIAERHKIEKV